MGLKFVWEENYTVGNPKLDDQHKGILEMANQLPEVADGRDTRSIIMQLYKYVREHFSHEEKMMKSINFPLISEQQLLHENFITELNNISSEPIDSDERLHTLKKFIYDWLINHIMYEDKKYFQFSREQAKTVSNKSDASDGKKQRCATKCKITGI